MHLLTALAIGVAANLDNGGVGVAYGLRRIRVPLFPNLLIALIGAAGTAIFGWAGQHLALVIPPQWGNWLGALVIIGVGLWVLVGNLPHRTPSGHADATDPDALSVLIDPALADRDLSGDISLGEASLLGVALGVNAWAGGLGAGLLGIPLGPVIFMVGLMSVLMLTLGLAIGSQVGTRWLGSRATWVAGILLILIGLKQLF